MLFMLINILSVIGILRISLDSKFDVFMPDNSSYKNVMEEMELYFPGSENIIFLIDTGSNELDLETLEAFREFQQFLSEHENIQYANGPAPEIIMSGRNLIRLNALKEEDLPAIQEYYRDMGELSPLVSYEGSLFGVFEAFPEKTFNNDHIHEMTDKLDNMGLSYRISGEKYMQLKIFDYLLRILLIIPPLALFLILLVFRSQMRSMKATIFSVLPAGIGALWTMGIIGWIGDPISIITVLAPIFTIVIGSADGLHFVSHVQEGEEQGISRTDTLEATLHMVGIPMIITTITSMVGFLVLLVMNNEAMRSLALFASLGIALAGIATWMVLPLILTGDSTLGGRKPRQGRSISLVPSHSKLQKSWGRPSLIIVLVLAVLSAVGIPRLTTEFSMLSLYKEYTEVQKGFELSMKVNGGSVPLFLYIEHAKNPLEPSQAADFSELIEQLEQSGHVGKVISPYTILSKLNGSMRGKESFYPEKLSHAQALYNIIARRAENPLQHFIDPEAKRSRIIVFPADLKNSTLDAIRDITDEFNAAHSDSVIQPTGSQYLFRELNQSIIQGQTSSIILAFLIIFLLLLISLRDLKASIIALLPIFMTIITLYGAMGLIGLSLNLITVTIFGITIGVGIDYAIHFTFVWKSFRRQGDTSEEAVKKAVTYTSRPIMTNGLGISIGLSALLTSPLLIHLYVSEMMWISMMVSMLLSLTFLPTLLRKVR